MGSVAVNPHTSDAQLRATGAVSLSATRNAATANSVIGVSGTGLTVMVDNTGGAYYVDRALFAFDTSAIPDAATITSATLEIYVSAGSSPAGLDIYLDLVTAAPADPTSLVVGDYDSFGTTRLTASSLNVWPATGTARTFTLNAAGLAAISKTSYTSLFVIMANDFENSTTSPTNLYTSWSYATLNSANAASNKPLLTVNYSEAGGSAARRRRPSGLYTR